MKANKHFPYHRPPNRFLAADDARITKYQEDARFAFMITQVDFTRNRLLDIGCNTGFFLFEALDHGAASAVGYEGAPQTQELMAHYIELAEAPITLQRHYYDFRFSDADRYDVVFLLNVVHHFGDDYGNPETDLASAKQKMLDNINVLASHCQTLIFQMGFNWHGDITKPIFSHGTKAEMIAFIRSGTHGFWKERAIGVADKDSEGNVSYHLLDEANILRRDDLGEFLNRPIFIMDSVGIL